MDRICQYSTIIFAGNMSVLLFVSIITDYWEYRGFDVDFLLAQIPNTNMTKVYSSSTSNTYFRLRQNYKSGGARASELMTSEYYQPPALVTKEYYFTNASFERIIFNGTDNVTEVYWELKRVAFRDSVVLFVEYGNLFRNCDDLEGNLKDLYKDNHLSYSKLPLVD